MACTNCAIWTYSNPWTPNGTPSGYRDHCWACTVPTVRPAGEFAGYHPDGGRELTTQAIAQSMLVAKTGRPGESVDAVAARMVAEAERHFSTGYDGTTSDQFHADVLHTFGRPVPEYPTELRAAHQQRAERFRTGAAGFAASMVGSHLATVDMGRLLESGRQQADRD